MANNASERVVNGIKTRVLHGKDYVEVNTRIQILHELRKAGEIKEFEMVESQPHEIAGQVFWRVSIRIDGHLYIGNAEVKLDAPKNTPDGTNPICCAETSALGRCLAFAGLGTLESIASYDEIVRGQPAMTVIESTGQTAYNRQQIASPASDSKESTPPRKTSPRVTGEGPALSSAGQINGKNGQQSPLNTIYLKAREGKLFTTTRGNEQADFLTWVGSLFPDRTVASSADISQEMIEYLEAHVSQEATHA